MVTLDKLEHWHYGNLEEAGDSSKSVWKGHIFQWGGGSCEKRLNRDWFTKPKKGREWKERPAQKRKGEKLR